MTSDSKHFSLIIFAQKMFDFGWRLSFLFVVIQNKLRVSIENIGKSIKSFWLDKFGRRMFEKASTQLCPSWVAVWWTSCTRHALQPEQIENPFRKKNTFPWKTDFSKTRSLEALWSLASWYSESPSPIIYHTLGFIQKMIYQLKKTFL